VRILYLEDEPVDADLARRAVLRHDPHSTVEVATTLAEARSRLAESGSYDLVLSDVSLPDGTGPEFVSEIREQGLPLAVVMLTGTGDVDTVVAALKAGADDYLVKEAAHGPRLPLTLESALRRFRAAAARKPAIVRLTYVEPDAATAEATRRHLERHAPNIRLELLGKTDDLRQRFAAEGPLPCDVLLLECRMEGGASLEVLKGLLDEGRLHVPVVMLGGGADEQLAAHALRLGANVHYLVKHPSYMYALPATIENAHRSALLAREEAALRDSQARLAALVDNAMDAIVSVDGEQRIVLFNPAAEKMFRCSRDEALGQPLERFIPERFRGRHMEWIRAFAQTGVTRRLEGSRGTITGLRRDGEEFPIEASVSKVHLGGEDVFTAILRDVAERTGRIERLHESEERFRQLAETIQEVFWIRDPAANKVLYVSPAYERIWGRSRERLYDNPSDWLEPIHPEDRSRALEALHDLTSVVYRIVRGDGSVRWIHDRAFPVRNDAREVTRVVGVAEDITERKRGEDELRQAEERFRSLYESATVGLYRTTPDGRILMANPAALRMLGYDSLEELARRNLADEGFEPAYPRKEFQARLERDGVIVGLESVWLRRDGSPMFVRESARLVRDAKGAPLYYDGTFEDVTGRKEAEEAHRELEAQLRQSQKMEAVGRLAGGVAHDFNNMLSVILGYADLALRKTSPVDPLRHNLEQIRGAARRSADLTRQLLAFSRRQTIAPRVLDLNVQMKGMERLLHRLIGEDIDLGFRLSPEVWPVFVDPSQVDQVLANLAVNSRDAMPDGGRLDVETRNVVLDEAFGQGHPDVRPGEYVMLAVSDNGCGMDDKTLERAFEPFFTTKPESKGTGLGLSTVYGIAQQNGGSATISSEPGGGTTVRLYLPRSRSAEKAEPMPSAPAAPARGHETVLLVEDEAQLREIAKELLETLGYTVLDAASPGDALTLCETHEGRIDLLLTDVVMPAMNGKELAARIEPLKPGIRVLFMSGYTADAIAHRGVLDPGVVFLEKPFSFETLASGVRRALDRPR
jgi:PAS domain S-box-containing protein